MNDDTNSSLHNNKHNEHNSKQFVPNTEQNDNRNYGGDAQRHLNTCTECFY